MSEGTLFYHGDHTIWLADYISSQYINKTKKDGETKLATPSCYLLEGTNQCQVR